MKTEKVVLYFMATLVGLLVAGGAFFLYQSARTIPATKSSEISLETPSLTPSSPSIFLTLDSPKDEEVVNKRIVTISGLTKSDATILILIGGTADVISPSKAGSFSTTEVLGDDENVIEVTAIAPDGSEKKLVRTVTFSNEDF